MTPDELKLWLEMGGVALTIGALWFLPALFGRYRQAFGNGHGHGAPNFTHLIADHARQDERLRAVQDDMREMKEAIKSLFEKIDRLEQHLCAPPRGPTVDR